MKPIENKTPTILNENYKQILTVRILSPTFIWPLRTAAPLGVSLEMYVDYNYRL